MTLITNQWVNENYSVCKDDFTTNCINAIQVYNMSLCINHLHW